MNANVVARNDSQDDFVEDLERFMQKVPGSGPYMLDIEQMVDEKWGAGTFHRYLGKIR
jgi:hypothetical protein